MTEEKFIANVRDYPLATMAKEVERVCRDWGITPIPVYINGRLSRCRGKFFWYGKRQYYVSTPLIEMSKYVIQLSPRQTLKTLRHELAHYIEFMMHGKTGHSHRFWEIFNVLHQEEVDEK